MRNRTDSDPMWSSVGRSAATRLLVLPVSAVLGIVITRLIIESFGEGAYAQYGLLVAVGALLPFADLGMSAAIMNSVGGSEDPSHDEHVRRVLVTSIRVLICSGSALLVTSAVISALGLWRAILGDALMPGSGPLAAALCLVAIAITVPVSFGQRVLTGLGHNHITVGLAGLQSPIVLLVLVMAIRLGVGDDGGLIAVASYAATLLLATVAVVIAARLIRPQIGSALRSVPRIRSERGEPVADVAWPMLVQAIALPIAMQSDRLVLSHVSSPASLATYNLSAQMFLPVWQVITASAAVLWPFFARARARGEEGRQSPFAVAAGFAGAAGLACLAISVVSPWLARIASGGEIAVPLSMLVAFSVLMVAQAIQYPLGQFLTDPEGLRIQAALVVVMVPFNVGLSVVLADRYGAVGPVVGSAVAAIIFQVGGNVVFTRRRLARPR